MANEDIEFQISIDRNMREIEGAFREFIQAISIEALSRVVQKTPVDTGRARSNWNTGIGKSVGTTRKTGDKSGGSAINRGTGKIGAYPKQKFPIVSLSNNLPYINALENGSSKQAPQGMVAVTLEELANQNP